MGYELWGRLQATKVILVFAFVKRLGRIFFVNALNGAWVGLGEPWFYLQLIDTEIIMWGSIH